MEKSTYARWKDANPKAYQAMLEKNREWKRRSRNTVRGHLQVLLGAAKNNSPARGLEVTITLDHLQELWEAQGGHCALTGDAMTTVGGKGRHANPMNASLDRIDSGQGYVPGNVWLVAHYANRLKTDLSMSELLDACQKILANHLKQGAA